MKQRQKSSREMFFPSRWTKERGDLSITSTLLVLRCSAVKYWDCRPRSLCQNPHRPPTWPARLGNFRLTYWWFAYQAFEICAVVNNTPTHSLNELPKPYKETSVLPLDSNFLMNEMANKNSHIRNTYCWERIGRTRLDGLESLSQRWILSGDYNNRPMMDPPILQSTVNASMFGRETVDYCWLWLVRCELWHRVTVAWLGRNYQDLFCVSGLHEMSIARPRGNTEDSTQMPWLTS